MDDSKHDELPAAAGKQVAFVQVYGDEQDREVIFSQTETSWPSR